MTAMHKIISADSHIVEPPDLWTSRAPAKYKDQVPHIVHGEVLDEWWIGNEFIQPAASTLVQAGHRNKVYEDKQFGKLSAEDWDNAPTRRWESVMPGAYQPKVFLKDNELDGIHASVIYPSVGLIFFKRPNSPLLREIFKTYNDWMAEFCSENPNRLRGVAMILLDDVAESVKELERCHNMGLAAAQIPTYPEPHKPYDADLYEPFWEAAEALRMPLGLHIQSWRPQPIYGQMGPASAQEPEVARFIGEQVVGEDGRTGMAEKGLQVNAAFKPVDFLATTDFYVRRAIGEMIFSGVFERHPKLYVVGVEYDTGFVPYFLNRMDWTYKEFADFTYHLGGGKQPRFKNDMLPSDFWRQNVRMTFQEDSLGLFLREQIGVETMMWGSDYPHREATWPISQQKIDEFFDGLTIEERTMITGGNAAKVYNVQ